MTAGSNSISVASISTCEPRVSSTVSVRADHTGLYYSLHLPDFHFVRIQRVSNCPETKRGRSSQHHQSGSTAQKASPFFSKDTVRHAFCLRLGTVILTEHISGWRMQKVSDSRSSESASPCYSPVTIFNSVVRSSLPRGPLDDQKITGNMPTVQYHNNVGDTLTGVNPLPQWV